MAIQVFAVLALAFVMAVKSEWGLILVLILGLAAGLIPFFVWRGNSSVGPIAIIALVSVLTLAGVYVFEKRWVSFGACLLSVVLLIHGVFLPILVRPTVLESLQKFGVIVMLSVPIIAAILAKEISLLFRPRPKSNWAARCFAAQRRQGQ